VKKLVAAAMMIMGGLTADAARAQKPPLLPERDVAALANELTGRRRREI